MPLSRNQKACISGFAYNELDGILYLILVDDINFTDEIPTLLIADAERLYKRARNFFHIPKKLQGMVKSQMKL